MFHQYAEAGNVWICGQCGMLSHGDPTSRFTTWEALGD
jgi:rubrerythrin